MGDPEPVRTVQKRRGVADEDSASARKRPFQTSSGEVKIVLCQRCRETDWNDIASWRPSKDKGRKVASFPDMDRDTLNQSSCDICRMVALVTPRHLNGEDCLLQALSSSLTVLGPYRSKKVPAERKRIVDCTVLFPVPKIKFEHKTEGRKTDTDWQDGGCLAVVKAGDQESSLEIGPRQISSFIDFDLVRSWLNHCATQHRDNCRFTAGSSSQAQGLKVIDCFNPNSKKAIDAPEDCKYVALSYVWGNTAVPKKEGKDTDFPQVVHDAIQVTRSLNERYLWVDQVCIDQKDETMKRAQVAQMNQIYSRAYLTLVAAAGSDASYGLPGIRSRPRRPLQRVVLNNIAIIRMLPHTSAQIFRSTWASRGWTYQECFLSTRRLIFTEHEVSYLCNTMDHAETVNKPLSNSRLRERVSDAKFLELIPSQDSLNGVSGKLKELRWNQLKQKQLPNYTKRQLSKTSDTIDAARGLFHALENSKIRHFYGIPFRQIDARNRSRYIFSLAWHHQEVAKRNLPFPSWSWAGWVGGIQMSEPDFCSSDDQEIEIEKEDGSTMPLQDWFCGQEQSPISEIRNGPQVLGISAMTVWVNFARRSWTGLNEKSGVQSQIVGMTFASGDYAVLPIREGLTAWCYAYMDWDNVPLEAGLLGLVLQTKQQKRYSILLLRKSGDHHERVGLVRVHSWNLTRAATAGDSENSDPAIIYTNTEGTPLDNVAISDERPLWLQEAVKRTIWIS